MQTKTVPSTRVRRGQTAEEGSQRRGNHVKSEMSQRASLNNMFREGSRGKTTPSEHTVAVTTQEALDGYRERTMRMANVENNTENWVSSSSAGALDMTNYDFSVRLARDEMRHIIGSSEPDVISGSDQDQNRGCRRKDADHMKFLRELCEAQAVCCRHLVHEQTSEVNSRTRCVTRIMAMSGTRAPVADLCMFGLAACDEGGPGFVIASVD